MQVSVETTSNLERKVTVGVPADQVDSEVTKRLQQASHKVRIDGFRAGKVPFKIVKQRFGEGVRQEVLGEVINRTYFEALEQEKLNPAGMPNIDTTRNTEGEDLEYVATVEVYPEIKLVDFTGIEIEKPVVNLGDADVDKMIENLRKQQASWEAVDRAAKDGDQVVIDFTGTKDGEAFAGGTAEQQTLVLGSGSMIPGFESGIEGMKAGDEKTLSLTFPEDYHAEELKGAAVEFAVKLHTVSEQKLPEVNEAFFKAFGIEKSAEEGGEAAFREEVLKNMNRETAQAQKNQIKTQVLDKVFELQPVDIPQALIASEIENMRKQMLQQFGDQAKSLDTASLLPDSMFEEQAQKRVALGLIMGELIQANEFKAEDDKVQAAIADLAATYHEPEQVVQYYTNNEEARRQIESMVLEDAAIDHILSMAKVSEKETQYEELVKQ